MDFPGGNPNDRTHRRGTDACFVNHRARQSRKGVNCVMFYTGIRPVSRDVLLPFLLQVASVCLGSR